jgi:hypothetical protein
MPLRVIGAGFGCTDTMSLKAALEAGPYMLDIVNNYFDNRMRDLDYLILRFKQHIDEVKAAIPPERLLVFEAKQGWEPLCEFLELPVPEGDFLHINDSDATREIILNTMEKGFQEVFGYWANPDDSVLCGYWINDGANNATCGCVLVFP